MLLQLLRLVVEAKGPITLQALARSLGVGEETARMMMGRLVGLGYLDGPPMGAGGDVCGPRLECGGCQSCSGQFAETPSIWNATAKGRRLVESGVLRV